MRIKTIVMIIASFIASCSAQKNVIFDKNSYAKLSGKAEKLNDEQLAKENEKFLNYTVKRTPVLVNLYKIENIVFGFSQPLEVKPTDESLEKSKKGLDGTIKEMDMENTNKTNIGKESLKSK